MKYSLKAIARWLVPLMLLGIAGAAFGADAVAAKPAMAPLTISLDAGAKGGAVSDALRIVLLLTLLAVLPAILIAMTSFTRTIIVLSMLRHAFGMQDTPPNMVLVSLAMFLTAFVMAPTFEQSYDAGVKPLLDQKIDEQTAFTQGVAPFKTFMLAQVREKDLALFIDLSNAGPVATPQD